MIVADKSYIETPDDDTPLMHYMNVYQFLSILRYKCLMFSSVSLYTDAMEAALSKPSYKEVSKFLLWEDKTPIRKDEYFFLHKKRATDKYSEEYSNFLYNDYWKNNFWQAATFSKLIRRFARYFMFTHCWSIAPTENILMWDRYKDRNATIGIKTTVKRIKNSFAEVGPPLYIGKIKYKNYNTEHIAGFKNFVTQDLCDPQIIEQLFYQPILHKQKIYEAENEVRIIICFKRATQKLINKVYLSDIPFFNYNWGFDDSTPYRDKSKSFFVDIDREDNRNHFWVSGTQRVKVNVNELVEKVILSPYTDSYVLALVQDMVKHYDIEPDKVINSSIRLG